MTNTSGGPIQSNSEQFDKDSTILHARKAFNSVASVHELTYKPDELAYLINTTYTLAFVMEGVGVTRNENPLEDLLDMVYGRNGVLSQMINARRDPTDPTAYRDYMFNQSDIERIFQKLTANRPFLANRAATSIPTSPFELPKDVIEELPGQIVERYREMVENRRNDAPNAETKTYFKPSGSGGPV